MGEPRDSQRSRVYAAGWEVAPSSGWLGERSARALLRSLGVSMAWGRKSGSSASGWADWVRRHVKIMPTAAGAASMEILLHEAAHVWVDHPFRYASHGPEYCRVLLDLTERVQGWDKRMELAGAFGRHRVKVAPAGSVELRWDLKGWEWPKATKKSLKL